MERHLLEEDEALLRGLRAYRDHPGRRDLPDPPAPWTEGATRLLDHGGSGPGLLLVPSLVNRSTVLDLRPGQSMARWLAAEGARVFRLDWGWPGAVERGMGLTDWVAGRLERAMGAACEASGGPVALLGYCMGGMLALAAAGRRPERVSALALVATPWDFHAGGQAGRARAAAALLPALEPWMAATGALHPDALGALFAALDPEGIPRKFRAFGRLDPGSERAAQFVAIEDWLGDGVPLPAPVAREALGGWYGRNEPARGLWRVAGAPVEPRDWAGPALVVVPRADRIVPPESALPLAAALPRARLLETASGHVALAAGSGAEARLWRPLRDWLGEAARA